MPELSEQQFVPKQPVLTAAVAAGFGLSGTSPTLLAAMGDTHTHTHGHMALVAHYEAQTCPLLPEGEDELFEDGFSPRRSPVMASMIVPDERFSPSPIRRHPASPSLGETVQSAAHKVCDIRDLSDIIVSARAFSDLTNPNVIRAVCVTRVAAWNSAKINARDISVSQIMAGLTNQLFTVALKDSVPDFVKPRKALFRVYGKTVGDLYDSNFELQVFKTLAKNESAPKLIADFEGGRIEEYILGPALLMKDMGNPAVLCGVATILGKFHKLHETVPEIASWLDSPEPSVWFQLRRWSKKASSLYYLAKKTFAEPSSASGSSASPSPDFPIARQTSLDSVASTEDVMLDKARLMSAAAKKSMLDSLEDTLLLEMLPEVEKLPSILMPKGSKHSSVLDIAFCHNDVQENNILVTGTRLRLIDFEYANFNYPAFDIANFFCEMTIDYCVDDFPYYTHEVDPAKFPSEELMRMFASVYLSQSLKQQILPSNEDILPPCVEAVSRFVLASHLLWGFWSIIRAPQAATTSDFDFLLYAKSRFVAYKKWKNHLIEKGYIPNTCNGNDEEEEPHSETPTNNSRQNNNRGDKKTTTV